MSVVDWNAWHRIYDGPSSPFSERLALVQAHIAAALDAQPPGPVPAISVCAGQGRDLLGILAAHPRGSDVSARLVELDVANVEVARAAARAAGLEQVEVVCADATDPESYAGAVPARIVIVCGVLGNVASGEIPALIHRLPELCHEHAIVIWTHHRRRPDIGPRIRSWFDGSDFLERELDKTTAFTVGSHELIGEPQTLDLGRPLFEFVPDAAWLRSARGHLGFNGDAEFA